MSNARLFVPDIGLEFWRIRDLIGETAKSIRRKTRAKLSNIHTVEDHGSPDDGDKTVGVAGSISPQCGYSLESDGTDEGNRHFMLVFFDVLLTDGQSLLYETYDTRRDVLQSLITEIEGYVSFMIDSNSFLIIHSRKSPPERRYRCGKGIHVAP